MLYRIKQVWAAITARLTPRDRQLIYQYLTSKELELFSAMSVVDQTHTIAVTRTLLESNCCSQASPLLLQAALLHDIGKSRYSISLIQRVCAVVVYFIWKNRIVRVRRTLQKFGFQRLSRGLFIYHCHPRLGASMAKKAGIAPEVIRLIRYHHQSPRKDDPKELVMLRKADSLN